VSSGKDIVVGDFNLQVDNPGDANASKFYALLESVRDSACERRDTPPRSYV
jgi:hypothetical protein